MVEENTLTGHADRSRGSRASLTRCSHCGGRAISSNAGGEPRELQIIAAVKRQFLNALILDHGTDGSTFCFDYRRPACNLHDLRDVAYLKSDIESGDLANLQHDVVADLRSEPLHFHFERILARRQRRQIVQTIVVGFDRALRVGR